jgi:hypothetical protein
MKRHTPLRRHTALKRSSPPPAINVERVKRRREKYEAHLKSAYFREIKRQVRERSGGRCERMIERTMRWMDGEPAYVVRERCWRDAAVYNHLTYVRFGHELPEDISHDCKPCEREYENARPWRAQRRAALARMQG